MAKFLIILLALVNFSFSSWINIDSNGNVGPFFSGHHHRRPQNTPDKFKHHSGFDQSCTAICMRFLKFLHTQRKTFNTEQIAQEADSSPIQRANEFCKLENLKEIQCDQLISNAEKISARDSISCFGRCGLNICKSPDVCPLKTRRRPSFPISSKLRPRTSVECKVCQNIVKGIKLSINVFNYSEQQVKNAIEILCKTLAPLKIQYKECKLVLDSVDQVFQWIENKVEPKDICIKIGACANGSKIIDVKLHKLLYGYTMRYHQLKIPGMVDILIQQADRATTGVPYMFGLMEMNRHNMLAEPMKCPGFRCHHRHHQHRHRHHHKGIFPQMTLPGLETHFRSNPGQCVICKSVVAVITAISAKYEITNETIEELLQKVRPYCNALPHRFADECLTVLTKIEAIAEMIEKHLTPDDICVKLSLCQGNDDKSAKTHWKFMQPRLAPRLRTFIGRFARPIRHLRILNKATPTCQVCDAIKENVDKSLQYYVEEMSQVTQDLTQLCNATKNESSQAKCLSAAGVLKMMKKNVGKKLVPVLCESIKCIGPISPFAGSPFRRSKSCQKCQKIASVVQEQFKYIDSIMAMVLKDVGSICLEFGDKATADKCESIVNKTKETMAVFEKMLNPLGICETLGICKSSEEDNKSKTHFLTLWKKTSKAGLGTSCRLCKVVSEFIEESKKSMAKMKKDFQKQCLKVTGNAERGMCVNMAKSVDDIVAKDKAGVKRDQICQDLQFCGSSTGGIVPIIKKLSNFGWFYGD